MPIKSLTVGLGLTLALSVAMPSAHAAITPPNSGALPTGINLVVCADGTSAGYSVDGPVFRSGSLAAGQCKGLTVQPGQYHVSMQNVAPDQWQHSTSVTRPGSPRATYKRTWVHTGVDAVPAAPTFGPTDGQGYPTGVNSATSGPGINVTVVVFQRRTSGGGSSAGGSSGGGSGSGAPCVVDHVTVHHCP